MDLTIRTESFLNEGHDWLGSARGLQSTQSIALAVAAFSPSSTFYPNGFIPAGTPLALATSGTYSGKYVPLAASANEAQTVTITGTPTGGTFTLTFDGQTTAGIAYNATAAAVQSALEALSNINPGDVAVTGGPGPGTPYVVTFVWGESAGRVGRDVPQMTTSGASLTGGTSPASAVSTTTAGGPDVTDGTSVLAGFLAFSVNIVPLVPGASVPATVAGALLDTGRVIVSKLPIAVSAAQQATNPRFVYA
jgi:hypothetical protein